MCLSREDKTPCTWFASPPPFPAFLISLRTPSSNRPPSSPHPSSPTENEVLCPFHYCPSWSWAWAAGAFWSASTRTRAEPSWAPHSPGYSLPPQTSTSPQSPSAGKGKRKMSKTGRDINRMVGQYQWGRWTEGKTQKECGQNRKRGHFTLKWCSHKMSHFKWTKMCPAEQRSTFLCWRHKNAFSYFIKSTDEIIVLNRGATLNKVQAY